MIAGRRGSDLFVEPLANELEAQIFMPLDVTKPGEMEAVFKRIAREWGTLDFLVYSIACSPRETLCRRIIDAPREGFLQTMRRAAASPAS